MMTDREKLFRLLLNAFSLAFSLDSIIGFDWNSCELFFPNVKFQEAIDYLLENGVTVRTIQKPLTLEELHDVKADAFLEVVDCPDIFHVPLPEFDDLGWIEFREVGGDKILFACDKRLYGKVWRCWANRPTEEERQAAKWEDTES